MIVLDAIGNASLVRLRRVVPLACDPGLKALGTDVHMGERRPLGLSGHTSRLV